MSWVRPSPEDLGRWWSKIKDTDSYWCRKFAPDFETFEERFSGDCLVYDFGWGVGRVTGITAGHAAVVHALFWSPEAFRRTDEIRNAIESLMVGLDLVRIECVVPAWMRGLRRLLHERLGFQEEGRLHMTIKTEHGFEDTIVYAIVDEGGLL